MAKKNPPKKVNKQLSRGQLNVLVAVILLVSAVVFFWFWYYKVYLKPENVFWGTMSNNLSVGHVTRTSTQVTGERTLQQVTNLQFDPVLAARTLVTISDKSSDQKVVTETVGTPNADYLRYVEITDTQNPPVSKDVIGVWAKQEISEDGQPQILSEALLGGVLIFGGLDNSQNRQIMEELKTSGSFTKYDLVAKRTTDSRTIYTYNVTVNIASYTNVYKTYLKMIGQEKLAEQLGNQDSDAQYDFVLDINATSRLPFALKAKNSEDIDTFSNFGTRTPIIWPDTQLTITELQAKISGK